MSTLVLAEHDNNALSAATLSTISAAKQLGEDIHVLVAGEGCSSVAEAAANAEGVNKVRVADHAAYGHQLSENVAALIAEIGSEYTYILAAATSNGKNILPRAAAHLDVGMLSEIMSVESADTFKRPIYAGNAIATVQTTDNIKVMTVRATSFEAVAETGGSADVENLDTVKDMGISLFDNEALAESDRPELASAKIVISGGRALESSENFEQIYKIADILGAAVGASRAAVDAGYVPNDMQVGQTGKVVAPELYVAVGISGAIQHLAGMKDSKVIVAINKDEEAPIFQVADYGLVADLFEALPEFEKLIS